MPKKFLLSETGDRGWYVGNFEKSCHKTEACEVSYMTNYAGELHEPHYHKIATEIHLVISGSVRINEELYGPGEICVIKPMEVAVSEYLEDTNSVVVKVPGPLNDKYHI